MNLPRSLSSINIKNAKLIENRIKQLQVLPKHGVVAEIGVFNGDYSKLILKYNKPSKLYLIDINQNYTEKLKLKFKKEIDQGQVVVINKSSFTAHNDFRDGYFDWVYIDGGHDYNSVSKDCNNFESKIKHDGYMVHNDYILYDHIQNIYYGTMHAINEFCLENNWEIIYYSLSTNDFKDVSLRRIKF